VNAQRKEALLSVQDAVVRIANALTATGELDNTYLFFLSDNGYILGEHRIRGGKVAPYEVSVKVPMLIRGPGIEPGTVVSQPTGLQDFAPTVLAMTSRVHAQGPFAMDGTNLLPMLSDPTLHARRPIVIEAGPGSATETEYRYHGIIAPTDGHRWKYVVRGSGSVELYDLTADPYELENVAGDPDQTTVRARMRQLLNRYMWCTGQECL
jgi:N-acetylglucosamine-6-sulfatase